MTHFKRGRLLVVMAVVALVAAACTASGESGDEPSQSSVTAAQETTTTRGPTTPDTSDTPDSTPNTTLPDDTPAALQVPEGVDILVEVTMDEFSFDPDPIEVLAGLTYYFVITNEGLVPHEFRLSNPHRIEEHMASGHDDHDDEGSGDHHEEDGDVFIELEAGETGDLMMTFSTNTTLYTHAACLLPGHYEAGMVTDLAYVDA